MIEAPLAGYGSKEIITFDFIYFNNKFIVFTDEGSDQLEEKGRRRRPEGVERERETEEDENPE